ncbi:hypothetical protein Dsin_024998 [Dipteronia sinensis]|uniref:RNase H type-1 domain-containing protein n=1 Tax=Dipteronia sinensis TaxID=43782 RepID=A0AAD9ZWF1_9ROSI|nr:hypothetical protein Dsin_024998 [Dipteronia sinensis]
MSLSIDRSIDLDHDLISLSLSLDIISFSNLFVNRIVPDQGHTTFKHGSFVEDLRSGADRECKTQNGFDLGTDWFCLMGLRDVFGFLGLVLVMGGGEFNGFGFYGGGGSGLKRATAAECNNIKRILGEYSAVSGQITNFQKSDVGFSKNVAEMDKVFLANILEMRSVKCHDRYLGIPCVTSQNKQKPNSLAARVIGGCYYSTTDFHKARASKSVSFLWRSLCWGRELIEKGSRWLVGNERSVLIYGDQWIPRPISFKVLSQPVLGAFATVDRLEMANGEWNEMEDSLLWLFNKSGGFLVRSGYWVAKNIPSNPYSSGLSSKESWWKFFWHLQLPSKVKIFAPELGTFKINTDVALATEDGLSGFEVVIRDDKRYVRASTCDGVKANYPPQIEEALAIYKGILLAVNTGLLPAVLKSDSLTVVNDIRSQAPNSADVGVVISDILCVLLGELCFA